MAIASLICGVLGLMCCLPGPVGLVLGLVSLRHNRDSVNGGGNRGMAIAGIVLGALASLVLVIYLVAIVVSAATGA